MLDIYATSLVFVPGMEKYAKYHKLEGRTYFQGLPISIENEVGSTRRGVSPDGKPWATTMSAAYGYIRGTMGVDGDEIDVFVGPNHESTKVFVVHQLNPSTGAYDEDKCILGVNSEKQAKALFLKHYDSKKFLGEITELSMRELKATAARSKMRPGKLTLARARRTKPKRLPSKEWERAFNSKYDQDKKAAEAEPSSLLEDFAAGVDPLGVFTNAFGNEAEKAKLSEEDHAVKHMVGTAGGFLGGATLVPSTIMGIIGAAKGAAKGGPGGRLAGAGRGFVEGFQTPIIAPVKALIAKRRIANIAEKGEVGYRDLPHLMPIVEHMRVPDAVRASKSSHLAYDSLKSLSDDIGKGLSFDDAVDNTVSMMKTRNKADGVLTSENMDLMERGIQVARGKKKPGLEDLLSASRNAKPGSVIDTTVDLGARVHELARTGSLKLNEPEIEMLNRATKEIDISLAENLAGLGLGGAIGAGGAYVQYGEGRKSRIAQEQEIANAIAAAKAGV